MAKRRQFLIWSEEHGGWWKPGRSGYTRSMEEAGRYSEDDAILIVWLANRYLPLGQINEVLVGDCWAEEIRCQRLAHQDNK